MGLAAALECAYFGVPAMLVERHSGTTWHPKARNLNSRTMEIMRRLGLEPELQAVGLPEAWTRQIVYADTLSGAELGRMGTGGFESRSSAASPCAAVLSSQDVFEPIWRGRAEQQPLLDVRYGHQAEILDVDAAGAVVRLTGARGGDVRARYLLAADGAGGAIRQGLGIGLEGPENLGHFINVYYRANLDRVVAHRPAVLYFTANEAGRGVFQPLDGRKRWLSQIAYDGAADTRAGFDGKRCAQWIRNAAGEPDLKVEILGISHWTMNATVAERYRQGAAFLVGDAAHQLPPTGGFGLNTGIQDVHNLVWKLAYDLRDWSDAGLVDTYEAERKPVARFNADRAMDNSRAVARIQRAVADGEAAAGEVARSRRYGNFRGLELGYSYRSAAVIDDGSPAPEPEDAVEDYVPCARPGHRMPHMWLEGGALSTLDLVQRRFLVLSDSARWLEAASQHNADCRVLPGNGGFLQLFGLEPGGAVLVRPDGHVAARFAEPPGFPGGALASALRDLLNTTTT